MKSLKNLGNEPISLAVLAEDVVEFHAARLLMLLLLCGRKGQIVGLTKLAKLDFFVRYPRFFNEVNAFLGKQVRVEEENVEAAMVRYFYGPWDRRYYQVLGYLEGRGLIEVEKKAKAFDFRLTGQGQEIANKLASEVSYKELAEQMRKVKDVLGNMTGTELKELIYKVFDEEIVQREIGEVIEG